MNTIIRDEYGIVIVTPTVTKTIAYLLKRHIGFYNIEDIQYVINSQVEEKERLTSKMIKRAIIEILSKYDKENKLR